MRTSPLAIGEHRGPRGRALAAPRRPRSSRRRLWLKVTLAVLALGLIAAGSWWLTTAPAFSVARVETGRYRFASGPAVEAALGRVLGRNIFTLPTTAVRDAFGDLPWVREVSLGRRLPDVLTVRLEEWQPRLLLAPAEAGGPALALVDGGRVLAWPDHLPLPALPWLVGVSPQATAADHWTLEPEAAGVITALLEALAATGLEHEVPVDFVCWTAAGAELVLQPDGSRLRLGREDLAHRLQRYLVGRQQVPTGAVVDLRFDDRITFGPPAGS